MRKTESYTEITEVVKVKHIATICDWCGDEIKSPGWMQFRELDIRFSKGWHGSHACGEGWEVEDLCDKCIDKLRKLLEDNGITIKDLDW